MTPITFSSVCSGRPRSSLPRWLATSIAGLAMAIAIFAVPATGIAADPPRSPNIILILADDLGYGHVGCFGQTKIQTPNLDRMAAEGMRFTQFYSGASVCAPARSTIMTGLHTGHTAVRNNGLNRHLYDEDVTVAEVLKKAGYITGGFGKWGLGRETTPGVAVKQGFDTWYGQYSQTHAHFYYPAFLMRNLEQVPLPENLGKRRGKYAQDAIHEEAKQFITANKDRPFFAYLPYILPHVELVAPPTARKAYEGRWPKISRADPRPGYLGSDDAYAEYAGMISHLDAQVGEIFTLLKNLKIDDDTIVVFTSDNGPQGGAWTDIFVEFFDGNGPFRGMKGNVYEGGIRVPMIARWPGRIRAGTVSEHVGYFPDLLPTFAELGGAQAHIPAPIDGISFVPTLLSKPGQKQHDFLYWAAAGNKQDTLAQAVRWGQWKAIRPKPNAAWELYDLQRDRAESRNVAADHLQVVAQIERFAQQAHQPERVYGPAPKESAASYVK